MQVDVAVIGGGVMGWSAAFWLTRDAPGLSVAVIERDQSLSRSSTALSVASIRQQFTTGINVKISRFGAEFIRDFARHVGPERGDLGFRENGYLLLAGSAEGATVLRRAAAMQRAEGAGTELLEPSALAARWPWLHVADVALAAFGPRDEGWFDNMGLRDGLRVAARASGAESVTAEVAGLARRADRVTALELADGRRIEAGTVVCAAGTGAAAILRLLGEDWPIEPRKRTVFVVDAPAARDPDAPLVVDHCGAYFRPEGAHWIAAVMPEADGPAAPDDFEPDLHQFEALLWPRLFARSESFAAARVVRAWAGHYAYNRLDQNAIVGRHPHCANLFLMNGFSGHGLQQAPAVGRGIAELVLHGGYRTLDLSPLAPDRVLTGAALREAAII